MIKYRIEYSGLQGNCRIDGQPFDNVPGDKRGLPAVIYAAGRPDALEQLADALRGSPGIPTVLTITMVERVGQTTKVVYDAPRTITVDPDAGVKERY